jgi:hypothetical protein
MSRHDNVWQGMAKRGMARHGVAWHGTWLSLTHNLLDLPAIVEMSLAHEGGGFCFPIAAMLTEMHLIERLLHDTFDLLHAQSFQRVGVVPTSLPASHLRAFSLEKR